MQNSLIPDYLLSLVPENVGNNSACYLRNARNLNYYPSTFSTLLQVLPSVTRDWNGLSEGIRNSPSLSSFKHQLNVNLAKSPIFVFDGKRLGQIYHARLRMRCSSLNAHLFSKNIVDSPLCACGSFEDTQHFLLSCTRYAVRRQELANKVTPICQLSINVLLYGNQELSNSTNKQIFLAVQEYLIKSKCFEVY